MIGITDLRTLFSARLRVSFSGGRGALQSATNAVLSGLSGGLFSTATGLCQAATKATAEFLKVYAPWRHCLVDARGGK